MLKVKTSVSMWGNSQALRIPVEITRYKGISANDEVVLKLKENILILSKPATPREETIEYLFRDYKGGTFKTELTNQIEPVGERNGK